MPILEYACHACGRHFDKLIRNISAPVETACPACGGTDVQRLMSTFAVSGASRGSGSFDFSMPTSMPKKNAFS